MHLEIEGLPEWRAQGSIEGHWTRPFHYWAMIVHFSDICEVGPVGRYYFCIGEMTYAEKGIDNRTLSGEGELRHRLCVRAYRRGHQPGDACRGVRILDVPYPPHPEGLPRRDRRCLHSPFPGGEGGQPPAGHGNADLRDRMEGIAGMCFKIQIYFFRCKSAWPIFNHGNYLHCSFQ